MVPLYISFGEKYDSLHKFKKPGKWKQMRKSTKKSSWKKEYIYIYIYIYRIASQTIGES